MSIGGYSDGGWPAYVPVAKRRRQAVEKVASMKKAGHDVSPVSITGRKIATSFWGEAWCKNLEAYSDFENRLPRGRTYVRNGSVVDLQIEAGHVRTLVSGTELYRVDVAIQSLAEKRWTEIKGRCASQIGSLVELLQGSVSRSVMEIVTRKDEGLFPSPREITFDCSCPDWAAMCKHVAATLYGVGARLDQRPELLFTLRGVDPTEMVEAAVNRPAPAARRATGRVLETGQLSSLFGVDIEMAAESPGEPSRNANPARTTTAAAKTSGSKPRAAKKRTKAPRNKKKASKKSTAAKPSAAKKTSAAKKRSPKKATVAKTSVARKATKRVKSKAK